MTQGFGSREIPGIPPSPPPPEALDMLRNLMSPEAYNQMLRDRLAVAASESTREDVDSMDVVEWLERDFWVPELNGPLQLADYQKLGLHEAFRRDEEGKFVYTTVVWGDIKKSIKSTIAAGCCLWRALARPYSQVACVANDLRQANSRVFYYITRAISLNPKFSYLKPIRYRIDLPNKSYIEALAIDPEGEAGGNPDFVVFSELWGSHQEAQSKMWTEMTIPPTKFGLGIRWVETYAGYSGESETLERLYHMGVNEGEPVWPGLPFWRNEDARMLVMWNEEPHLPWQSPEYYRQQAADLVDSEFMRIHRNKWVSSSQKFVPDEWIDGCGEDLPPLDKSTPVVLSADAGVSSDCFGITLISRHPKFHDSKSALRYARKWTPRKGQKLDYGAPGGPEQEIRRCFQEYNVIQFCYDEFQLHDMATRFSREGLVWIMQFGQGKDRAIADKEFYDAIRDKKHAHNRNADYVSHIKNANVEVRGEKQMRIVKRSELLKVDLAVCGSMGHHECMRLNL